MDPNAVLGVFPSDHIISRPKRYLRLLRPAFQAADKGNIVVLGIQPRWPETGYGYIEFPKGIENGSTTAAAVKRFREKPDLPTAKKFVKAGNFYWNAGMFFWKTSVLLEALRHHLPKTCHPARFPAPVREPQVRERAGRYVSAVREHLDRLRRPGEGGERGGFGRG